MSTSISQNSFAGGEWAPSLYARTDLSKYITAVRTMKNFVIHPHGGASNRGGTEFVGETKDSSKISRLIPFQFSVTQTYMLEFGDLYMRVYKDRGRVVETAKTITGATQANPVVITSAAHGYSNGDWVVIYGVVGMTELNGKTFVVSNKAAGTYELKDVDGVDIDGTGYGAYVSGGESEKIYELTTTYAEADLALLKFTQSADTLYITHPSYPVRKITRTGHSSWTIANITFAPDIAAPASPANGGSGVDYRITAVSATGEESLPSATVDGAAASETTWTAVGDAEYYNVFKDGNKSGTFGWIGQADTNAFTEPAATIDPDYSVTPPTANNPFSGAGDYPGVVTFFEQRLVFARTNNNPQTIWGSIVGNFENMNKSKPIKDDDSFKFTINARQVNDIKFMVPLNELILGTPGSEWKMNSGGNSDAVTPTSVSLKMQSEWGTSDLQPVVIGNIVLYIERSGDVVRDFSYSFDVDNYKGNDLTILAKHLFKGYTIDDWAYQQHPDSIIWCVRSDGTLLGLTYYKDHDVIGWHQHDTQGLFKSIASIPTSTEEDELYVIVERTINSVTRKYVEIFKNRLPLSDVNTRDVQDSYFVDSGLSLDNPSTISGATKADPVVVTDTAHGYSDGDYIDINEVSGMTEINNKRFKVANKTANTYELTDLDDVDIDGTGYTAYTSGGKSREAFTTISGLSHLEGKTVAILANGNVVSNKVVTSGAITLDNRASRIHIGLGYTPQIETLDYELVTETGTSQDKIRDINSVVMRLENTRAIWIGPDEDNLDEFPFRSEEDYSAPISLFTGDKEKAIEPGEGRAGRLFIENPDPVPTTILALFVRFDSGEY